ncbi:MAG: hypothetical protein JJE21_05775 [Spirochaetaceae bacterium]|nr:hypothetical protein [Spirochaetaceae bacterium]
MISYQEILNKVKNKESLYLKAIITGELMFPWNIAINKKETGNLDIDNKIYSTLYSNSKNAKVTGYRVESKTTKITQVTKLSKIIIEEEYDFIYLLNKKKEVEIFKDSINKFRDNFNKDILDEYLIINRKQIFNSSVIFIDNFIEVTKYLIENQNDKKYPRELDLKADTKFLSRNLQRITTFLKYFRNIDSNLGKYERIGLINPYSTVSLRLGNNFNVSANGNCFSSGISYVDLEDLKSFENTFEKIFVLENRTTFLKFPLQDNYLAIYMGGFAINILKDIPFLLQSELFYFGDLDEHGFEILSMFRELYPNAKSLCMDIETLNKYKDYIIEGKEFKGEIRNLTASEQMALDYLTSNRIDENSSRIEQEKISTEYLTFKINKMLK